MNTKTCLGRYFWYWRHTNPYFWDSCNSWYRAPITCSTDELDACRSIRPFYIPRVILDVGPTSSITGLNARGGLVPEEFARTANQLASTLPFGTKDSSFTRGVRAATPEFFLMPRLAAALLATALICALSPTPTPSSDTLRGRVRNDIKYVFIIVQENHTFDQLFGLYPGMNGQWVENLGTRIAKTDDCQPDPMNAKNGKVPCQRPFLISASAGPNFASDAPDISGGPNDRDAQGASVNYGMMNGFLATAEGTATPLPAGASSNEQNKWANRHDQALGVEALYDCDTVPYLWNYAKNFVLFDHYFQAETGPSTPSNIQLFAAQIGQTEVASYERKRALPPQSVPIMQDINPPSPAPNLSFIAWYQPGETSQSYATMPVLLAPDMDRNARKSNAVGLIRRDMAKEARTSRPSVPWRWYEEGLYSGIGLAIHHVAPLYFDYINHDPSAFANKETLRDNTFNDGLVNDIKGTDPATQRKLPESGGVFWIKGAKVTTYGFSPADAHMAQYFTGDDDHPNEGNSDQQVADAYLATVINAIASSKYWNNSVIIVTWDDSGGFFDHLPPRSFGGPCPRDASGRSCGDGVRLPALLISPYAKTGVVVHAWADHGSVAKFVEYVFGLPHLADLPDEADGVAAGLTPADGNPSTSNLIEALDPDKLAGSASPNPPPMIRSPGVPPNMSCASLGIPPIPAPASIPSGFHTRGWHLVYGPKITKDGKKKTALIEAIPDDGD